MIHLLQQQQVFTVDAIYQDIQKAARSQPIKDLMARGPVMGDWLKEINLSLWTFITVQVKNQASWLRSAAGSERYAGRRSNRAGVLCGW